MNEKDLTQEEITAIENDAMNAEMSGDSDAQAPGQLPAQVKQEEIAEENERVEVIPGWTQEELVQLKDREAEIQKLQKSIDTTNGTYGNKLVELQRAIDEIKSQKQPETAANEREITVDDFDELNAEYSELTEKLVAGLKKIMPPNHQQSNIDLSQIEEKFNGQLKERDQREFEKNLKRLSKAHPDFQKIATFTYTPDGLIQWADMSFGNWASQQPHEIQKEILNSDDPFELAEILNTYKASTKRGKKTAGLEKAIQPRGTSSARQLSDKEIEKEAMLAEMASFT